MRMGRGPKSQQERDAITVEIGYALVSAGFLAAVVFGVFAGPVVIWSMPLWAEYALLIAGALVAGTLAVVRVVHVLRQFGKRHDAES